MTKSLLIASGKIGISLTIVPTCSVTMTGDTPQVECGDSTTLRPKMSHSKRIVDDRESELITVEW